MSAAHDLHLTASGSGSCDCGEIFDGTATEAYEQWEDHVEITTLLTAARMHALNERAERAAGEDAIRRLLDLGVTSRDVSSAIGDDDTGRPLVSVTLVQRLGRDAFARHPRRRRA